MNLYLYVSTKPYPPSDPDHEPRLCSARGSTRNPFSVLSIARSLPISSPSILLRTPIASLFSRAIWPSTTLAFTWESRAPLNQSPQATCSATSADAAGSRIHLPPLPFDWCILYSKFTTLASVWIWLFVRGDFRFYIHLACSTYRILLKKNTHVFASGM